jgi:hypothetical protein
MVSDRGQYAGQRNRVTKVSVHEVRILRLVPYPQGTGRPIGVCDELCLLYRVGERVATAKCSIYLSAARCSIIPHFRAGFGGLMLAERRYRGRPGYWGANLVRNVASLGALSKVVDPRPMIVAEFLDRYKVPGRGLGRSRRMRSPSLLPPSNTQSSWGKPLRRASMSWSKSPWRCATPKASGWWLRPMRAASPSWSAISCSTTRLSSGCAGWCATAHLAAGVKSIPIELGRCGGKKTSS